MVSRTLGPFSDSLAEVGFSSPDPDIWQRIAERHDVGVEVEPVDGEPFAYDRSGKPVPVDSAALRGLIRAPRTAPDGRRVVFHWPVLSFGDAHTPLLGALLFMVSSVIGTAFWFLHRQLRPLTWLHSGVEAVGRGDFGTRVPVVREDEIGQVARAFNAMAVRVGEMIDDRERLLADVSHELRSPLARAKVALELLPESAKRDSIDRNLREMERLVSVLLEREGLRARAGRLEAETVDLAEIVRDGVTAFADRDPGVELAPVGPTPLSADPTLLRLLVRNLLDNAVKFSHADSRPVRVTLENRGDRIRLRVTDDGIGIPEGSEESLFEPFVKADPARGHRTGYGIGLNLCQRIVRLHGGTIRLRRREAGGTEAVVDLEHHPGPASRATPRRAGAPMVDDP